MRNGIFGLLIVAVTCSGCSHSITGPNRDHSIAVKLMEREDVKGEKVAQEVFNQRLASTENYLVSLVNMTDRFVVFYFAITDDIPSSFGTVKWTQISPISKTCDLDRPTCIKQNKFVTLTSVSCGSRGYLSIGYQDTTTGQWLAQTFHNQFFADCQYYRGTAYGLEN
jgi:hypothetical protein